MSEHKRGLVVGASRGLGLGIAAELKSRGWDVIATARDAAGADRLAALANRPGGALDVERLDIDDAAALAGLRDRLEGLALDLVLVNAGVIGPQHQDAARATPEEVGALFLTNAVAPVRVARALASLVRETTGVIAFMSSAMGSVAGNTGGGSELYRASKAALNSLTRSFVASLGGKRLTVLTLHPGWVRTDMGGSAATLSVEESARGIVDLLESRAGSERHAFLDYQGREVPW